MPYLQLSLPRMPRSESSDHLRLSPHTGFNLWSASAQFEVLYFASPATDSVWRRGRQRMFYDLCVPWSSSHIEIQRTLTFLSERTSIALKA